MFEALIIVLGSIYIYKRVYVLVKRFILYFRLKKYGDRVTWLRPFRSILLHNGVDLIVHGDSGDIAVSVFTSVHKRTRYHIYGGAIELIRARKNMFRVGRFAYAPVDSVISLRKYIVGVPETETYKEHVLLLYPAPFEVTCVEDNQLAVVDNGKDVDGFTVCSLSYFIDKYLSPSPVTA